jgi:hypothetical protein
MWHRVEIVLTNISEERIASIFRVEDKKKSAEQVQQTESSRVNTAVSEKERSMAT